MKRFGVGDKLKQKAFLEDIRYFATAIKKIDVLAVCPRYAKSIRLVEFPKIGDAMFRCC
jgi:hypothetical protein